MEKNAPSDCMSALCGLFVLMGRLPFWMYTGISPCLTRSHPSGPQLPAIRPMEWVTGSYTNITGYWNMDGSDQSKTGLDGEALGVHEVDDVHDKLGDGDVVVDGDTVCVVVPVGLAVVVGDVEAEALNVRVTDVEALKVWVTDADAVGVEVMDGVTDVGIVNMG